MNFVKSFGVFVALLVILSLFISIWMPFLEAFRAVFGGFYVLIAPGLVMTYAFFENEELNFPERIPFAFALSLATLPLLIFSLSRIGLLINLWSIVAVVAGLIGLAFIGVLIRNRKKIFLLN